MKNKKEKKISKMIFQKGLKKKNQKKSKQIKTKFEIHDEKRRKNDKNSKTKLQAWTKANQSSWLSAHSPLSPPSLLEALSTSSALGWILSLSVQKKTDVLTPIELLSKHPLLILLLPSPLQLLILPLSVWPPLKIPFNFHQTILFFHLFSEIQIRNNGEINRLVHEDDYHINKGNNNDVIVENGDGNDNGEDNNYDNVNNHDVQMLELEKTLDVYVKKANKSLFKWCWIVT